MQMKQVPVPLSMTSQSVPMSATFREVLAIAIDIIRGSRGLKLERKKLNFHYLQMV